MTRASDLAAEINKVLGPGTVRVASDPELTVTVIPTGVLPIDVLLEGGVPRGRFIELYGDSSTLKTYLGLKTIATAQSMGGIAAIVDTEHAFDPEWAEVLGVDTNQLIYLAPSTIEEAVDATEALVRAKTDVVLWDSVAASLPKVEKEKSEQETQQPARLAAAMSRATRKLNAANTETALIWINQTRIAVGVMYGSPERTPGGKSLPFYASHRIALRKAGHVTIDVKGHDGYKGKALKERTGQMIRASLEKSRLTKPHRDVFFTFDYRTGKVDESRFMASHGIETGVIVRKAQTYTVKGKEDWTCRGMESLVEMIETTPEMNQYLRSIFRGLDRPLKSRDDEPSEG